MALRPWGALAVTHFLQLGATGCAGEPGQLTEEITATATMLVADRGGDRIIAYRNNGEHLGVVADSATCDIDRPSSARMGPDGQLYVASFGNNRVVRFDRDGEGEHVFFGDAMLEEPVEIVFDGDTLYVLGNDTRSIAVVDPEGHLLESFGYPALRDAHDFAFGPDGLLYVCTAPSGHSDGVVQVWDAAAGTMVRSFAAPEEVELATSIAFMEGQAYVSDYRAGRVSVFDPATGARLAVLPHQFDGPIAIEPGPQGRLYLVDRGGIWAVSDAAATLVVEGAELDAPRSITFY